MDKSRQPRRSLASAGMHAVDKRPYSPLTGLGIVGGVNLPRKASSYLEAKESPGDSLRSSASGMYVVPPTPIPKQSLDSIQSPSKRRVSCPASPTGRPTVSVRDQNVALLEILTRGRESLWDGLDAAHSVVMRDATVDAARSAEVSLADLSEKYARRPSVMPNSRDFSNITDRYIVCHAIVRKVSGCCCATRVLPVLLLSRGGF